MNKIAQEILDNVRVGAMATINRDRTPAIAAVHFARMGDKIIWISDKNSQHSKNAFRTGKMEFVVWDDQVRGVFLKTTVFEVAESDKTEAMKAYQEKLKDFIPRCENPQLYMAPIGEIDEKTTTGNWLHYIA